VVTTTHILILFMAGVPTMVKSTTKCVNAAARAAINPAPTPALTDWSLGLLSAYRAYQMPCAQPLPR